MTPELADFLYTIPAYAHGPNRPIIGIAGRAGAGKDTFAKVFIEHRRIKGAVSIVRFAAQLKAFLGNITGRHLDFEDRSTYDLVVPGFGCTVREWLEGVGTHMRGWKQDFWVRAALGAYRPMDVFVVPDTRFLNEATAIQALGGTVVMINRPDDAPLKQSEKELHLIKPDYTILNDGTLDEYQIACRNVTMAINSIYL